MTVQISPLEAYAAALAGGRCEVISDGAETYPLPVRRWTREVSRSDELMLDHCRGDTLDVGCGPGRMTAALSERGHDCLGIDVSAEAVAHARRRGADAMVADVFADVPFAGRWQTALLADGNIGIGGDPVRLLRRISRVVAPASTVVVDLAPPGVPMGSRRLRLHVDGRQTDSFAWSVVGVDSIRILASDSGLAVETVTQVGERWFACLLTPGRH